MWQWLVVVPVIVTSAVYAAWALTPASTRLAFARWLARHAVAGPATLKRLAARLESRARPSGGCDSCPASRVAPAPGRRPPAR